MIVLNSLAGIIVLLAIVLSIIGVIAMSVMFVRSKNKG